MWRARSIIAALVVGNIGCGARLVDPCAGIAGTCVAVQVAPSATVTEIDQLAVNVTGDGVDSHKLVSDGKLQTLPVAIGVKLGALPRSPASVTITVVAIRGAHVNGYGNAGAMLTSGQHQTVTVRLDATAPNITSAVDAGAGGVAVDAAPVVRDLASTDLACASRQALCTAPSGASVCADVSSDPMNCGACGVTCASGTICVNGACGTSYAFPTDDNGGYTAARGFALTLQSLAPSTIYYTTDGSTPTVASAHGTNVVTFAVSTSGAVNWFTSTDPTMHTHKVTIDPGLQGQIGELADQVRFDKSSGPIVFAAPKETLGGLINDEVWNGQGYCPGCARVYGLGILSVEQCFAAIVPSAWPGTAWNDFRFTVHAPDQPGVYHLRRGTNLDFSCHPGTPVGSDDGIVIVQ